MQPFNWYIRRLTRMGPGEMVRRAYGAARDLCDAALLPVRQKSLTTDELPEQRGFRVTSLPLAAWAQAKGTSAQGQWRDRLIARAETIAAGRLSFFGYREQSLGAPIDWNRDHMLDKPSPMRFAPWIDYRDVRLAGDCKRVWEPSRHHQLVVLARAWRASGQARFAQAVAEQLDSWITQCPFGRGMQWRSPLELGIRLINWVWTLDLVAESGVLGGALGPRLANTVRQHIWDVDRKYSAGSSVNNHLVGEAAGVFIATCYFSSLRGAARWRKRSRDILAKAIIEQTFADGVSRELSSGYHLFVFQFFLLAGLVGHWSGYEFAREYWERLSRMTDFLAALADGGEQLPMLGDCDDGYVLDLAGHGRDVREWLAVAAAALNRNDLPTFQAESINWLADCRSIRFTGCSLTPQTCAPSAPAAHCGQARDDSATDSRAFPLAGYYLLASGGGRERISVLFDCGPLGLLPLAGHGHADALSFTLRAFGVDVLVDPGTYDYFSYRPWRDYFRSTAAHNAARVDGLDQSSPAGLFMWSRQATARCLAWQPCGHGGSVEGEHDGYARLADPVVHRRRIELDGRQRRVVINDEFAAAGRHTVELYFHFAEHCRLSELGDNAFRIDTVAGVATLKLDSRLQARLLIGSENPPAGWVSRTMHQKAASTTLVASGEHLAPGVLDTTIALGRPATGSVSAEGQ